LAEAQRFVNWCVTLFGTPEQVRNETLDDDDDDPTTLSHQEHKENR